MQTSEMFINTFQDNYENYIKRSVIGFYTVHVISNLICDEVYHTLNISRLEV